MGDTFEESRRYWRERFRQEPPKPLSPERAASVRNVMGTIKVRESVLQQARQAA